MISVDSSNSAMVRKTVADWSQIANRVVAQYRFMKLYQGLKFATLKVWPFFISMLLVR